MKTLHNSRNWGNLHLECKPEPKARKKWTSPIAWKPEVAYSYLFWYICGNMLIFYNTNIYILVANECFSYVISCQALPHGCQGALFHLTLASWQKYWKKNPAEKCSKSNANGQSTFPMCSCGSWHRSQSFEVSHHKPGRELLDDELIKDEKANKLQRVSKRNPWKEVDMIWRSERT